MILIFIPDTVHTSKNHARVKFQPHVHALLRDALSVSTGLIPGQAIFAESIACLYPGDVGQKPGFQSRKTAITIQQQLPNKHAQIVFFRPRQKWKIDLKCDWVYRYFIFYHYIFIYLFFLFIFIFIFHFSFFIFFPFIFYSFHYYSFYYYHQNSNVISPYATD